MTTEAETQDTPSSGARPIDMESFSELVGFPAAFIKKELLIDKDNLSIDELRTVILDYLDSTMK